MELTYPAILALLLVWSITGFILGKFHERLKWNELIDTGIIPAPKKYGGK